MQASDKRNESDLEAKEGLNTQSSASTEWVNEEFDFERWAGDNNQSGYMRHQESQLREVRVGDSVCCWSFSNNGVVVEAGQYSVTFRSPEGDLHTTCYSDIALTHVGPPENTTSIPPTGSDAGRIQIGDTVLAWAENEDLSGTLYRGVVLGVQPDGVLLRITGYEHGDPIKHEHNQLAGCRWDQVSVPAVPSLAEPQPTKPTAKETKANQDMKTPTKNMSPGDDRCYLEIGPGAMVDIDVAPGCDPLERCLILESHADYVKVQTFSGVGENRVKGDIRIFGWEAVDIFNYTVGDLKRHRCPGNMLGPMVQTGDRVGVERPDECGCRSTIEKVDRDGVWAKFMMSEELEFFPWDHVNIPARVLVERFGRIDQ